MPVRLQGEDRVELLGRVGHVGAPLAPLGDPVKAVEAHQVVDPQGPGVAEVIPQGGDPVAQRRCRRRRLDPGPV